MTLNLLLILLLSPIGIAVLHAIFSRLFKKSPNRQSICLYSVMSGYIFLFIALNRFADITVSTAIYSVMVYGALGYSYFHLFNMSETARRVRMLAEIDRKGRMTPEELSKLYPEEEMLSVRLDRLLSVGQIREKHQKYILGGHQLYYIAKALDLWGRLIKMPLYRE